MAVRTLLWRGLDEPRMEIVHVEGLDRAHGTQIGIAYELRWNLDGAVLEMTRDGGPVVRVELGGADFFDLHHSAFFNSLPVARDGLLKVDAAAREYTMRFVRVPELTAELVRQKYKPLGNRVVRYRSNGYQADITFDADGFVTLYQDYLERVA
ncbi:MAG: putative glycolipid-binding domain-containing protein [Actinobacteria bacterium]|nr:putative glycolipid-binding domain-containing protein [Actinomycetota bacterium]MBO0837144.1 putative glycolipid-binding domain-containing protein [Actinomycetota bacterium]